jgi:hypothetical protein
LTTPSDAGKAILQRLRRHIQFGESAFGKRSKINAGCVMPEYQPVSSAHVSAIERPRCPRCQQTRMLLSKLESGPRGFDYRTFECHKCGRVQTMVVSSDPMTSDVRGWLAGELKPPT